MAYKKYISCRKKAFDLNRKDKGVRFMLTHANEIIADYWGSKTLAYTIKKYFPHFSNEELKRAMTTSFSILCESAQTYKHPHKKYRMNQLFLHNFEVFKTFSCQNYVLKYTPHFCDLEGYKELTFGDVIMD